MSTSFFVLQYHHKLTQIGCQSDKQQGLLCVLFRQFAVRISADYLHASGLPTRPIGNARLGHRLSYPEKDTCTSYKSIRVLVLTIFVVYIRILMICFETPLPRPFPTSVQDRAHLTSSETDLFDVNFSINLFR